MLHNILYHTTYEVYMWASRLQQLWNALRKCHIAKDIISFEKSNTWPSPAVYFPEWALAQNGCPIFNPCRHIFQTNTLLLKPMIETARKPVVTFPWPLLLFIPVIVFPGRKALKAAAEDFCQPSLFNFVEICIFSRHAFRHALTSQFIRLSRVLAPTSSQYLSNQWMKWARAHFKVCQRSAWHSRPCYIRGSCTQPLFWVRKVETEMHSEKQTCIWSQTPTSPHKKYYTQMKSFPSLEMKPAREELCLSTALGLNLHHEYLKEIYPAIVKQDSSMNLRKSVRTKIKVI